jgi:glycogen synthase
VGDVEEMLEGEQVGVSLPGVSEADLRDGMKRLLSLLRDETLPERCVRVARENFSLDGGAASYRQIYHGLIAG